MNIHSILRKWWSVIFFSFTTITMMVIAVLNLFAHFRGGTDAVVFVEGQHNLSFRVFYHDGTMFDENPILQDQYFLMSYTNYIETNNEFTINLSHRMNVYYSYQVDKRLIIRQALTADASINPIVFQQELDVAEVPEPITNYITEDSFDIRPATDNRPSTYHFRFRSDNDPHAGSTHTIHPMNHMRTYLDFIEEQGKQMENHAQQLGEENIFAHGLRGFTAEIMIVFRYDIRDNERIADSNLNQTITYGYRIPLTTEVYSLETDGTPSFEWEHTEVMGTVEITLPMVMLFSVLFILSLFGLMYNIKRLVANPNKYVQEANEILKRYSNEVVIYDKPVNVTRYEVRTVQEFSELLKLAVNLNKHIMCYRDEAFTEFAVIVDDFACLYMINYEGCDVFLTLAKSRGSF